MKRQNWAYGGFKSAATAPTRAQQADSLSIAQAALNQAIARHAQARPGSQHALALERLVRDRRATLTGLQTAHLLAKRQSPKVRAE